jgi:hypothetical protein
MVHIELKHKTFWTKISYAWHIELKHKKFGPKLAIPGNYTVLLHSNGIIWFCIMLIDHKVTKMWLL